MTQKELRVSFGPGFKLLTGMRCMPAKSDAWGCIGLFSTCGLAPGYDSGVFDLVSQDCGVGRRLSEESEGGHGYTEAEPVIAYEQYDVLSCRPRERSSCGCVNGKAGRCAAEFER